MTVLFFLSGAVPARGQGRLFGLGHRFDVEDLPASRLRDQLESLPEPARHRAMEWMHRFSFPVEDVPSLHVDREGGVFYICELCCAHGDARTVSHADGEPTISEATVPIAPFPDALKFHSRPGAPNVLYLNFVGSNITGTAWNSELGRDPIPALPFSTDSDYTTFSDAEQAAIKRIWQRVAEDYAPFDVNVTTENPAVWNNRTAHALITRNTDANGQPNYASNAGGVAYVNVFGSSSYSYYRPAWVYHNNLANREDYIAEAASHEVGHNMGLSHDGKTDGTEYYGGHGSGATSWGPIMGTGYGRNVSQWCKGEYYLANNTQDDLAIVAGKMGYRPDDHGDTFAAASFLTITSNTLVRATTPETDPGNQQPGNKGVLIRTTDVDMWAFSSGEGQVSLTVRPWWSPANTRGGNLDVRVTLFDAGGAPIALHDPTNETFATVQAVVTSGVYYLKIEGVGVGDPLSSTPLGYTAYGSLGQYFITGVVADASGVLIPPQAMLSASNVTTAGVTSHTFQIVYTDDLAMDVGSLGNDDARVTGPGGYIEAAQLIAVDNPANGTPRTGTYRIPAPDGAWEQSDNGLYSVWINSNAVLDVEGASVPAGSIGAFTASVPVAVYSANMDADPNWTLEPLWAYGQPCGTGGMPASGATGAHVIGYNLSGNYEENLSLKYATTPAIDCSAADEVVLRFQRWLGLGRNDMAIIEVSTNGTAWSTIWSAGGTVNDTAWQLMQYDISAVAARSPSVRVRWGMGSAPPAQASFGWNLDDVEVLGVNGLFDATPPTASLFAMNVVEPGAALYEFSVTYTDESNVDVSTLGDDNIVVTGPSGYTNEAVLAGLDDDSNGSPRTGFYRIVPPGGDWDAADNGTYVITLLDGKVRDCWGNAMSGQDLGAFEVDISSPPPPSFGAVEYTLEPAKAREQGAQWRLADGEWLNSGDRAEDLEAGVYVIQFKELPGWGSPEETIVNVAEGETNRLDAAYEALMTTNHPTPIWWLIENGYTEDFEQAVLLTGANGFALWESYIAGLDPNDPASIFRVDVVAPTADKDGLILVWNAVSGRTYSVYWISSLGAEPTPVPDAQDMPWPQDTYVFPINDETPSGALRFKVQFPEN